MTTNRPSFEKVDYTVRPAKNIERKMLAEMFARLRVFRPVEDYTYVGLGSTFFSDFVLFHRLLGISQMVSIEREDDHSERIVFNKPFGCIQVEFGETTDVLPRLDWVEPAIVWLDYDDEINLRKLDDLVFLAQNLPSSSFLVVTLPAFPNTFQTGNPPDLRKRLDILRSVLGGKVPDSWRPIDTSDFLKTQRRIANAAIRDALASRNAALPPEEKISYEQVLFFRYADGATMVTFGGLFLNKKDSAILRRARLRDLPFFQPQDWYFNLDPPKLTLKERHFLDKQLPAEDAECPGLSEQFVRSYAQLYRYFPFFVEAEV